MENITGVVRCLSDELVWYLVPTGLVTVFHRRKRGGQKCRAKLSPLLEGKNAIFRLFSYVLGLETPMWSGKIYRSGVLSTRLLRIVADLVRSHVLPYAN